LGCRTERVCRILRLKLRACAVDGSVCCSLQLHAILDASNHDKDGVLLGESAAECNISSTTTTTISMNTFVYAGTLSAASFVVSQKQEELPASSANTVVPLPTPTPTPSTTESPPSSGGLSTGAKAGVGIGAALGLLIPVAVGFGLYRRRHTRKALQAPAAEWVTAEQKA
jgi:hypothetical protein